MYKAIMLASAVYGATAHAEGARPPSGMRIEIVAGRDSARIGKGLLNHDGAIAGLRAGYDVPLARNLTLGVEGELSNVTTEATSSEIIPAHLSGNTHSLPSFVATYVTYTTTSLGRTVAAGGRLTWWPAERLGLYLGGAYANQKVETCLRDDHFNGVYAGCYYLAPVPGYPDNSVISGHSGTSTRYHRGYRLAAGAQLTIGQHWFGSVEYRYTRLLGGLRSHQSAAALGLRF